MNLLCPSCQKMLQVPEQYAGQQMRCPLCNNLFTVPALPDTPALAPPPSPAPPPPTTEPAPYSFANEPPPPPPLPPLTFEPEKPSATAAPAPPPRPTPPLLVGDYTKLRSITISPRVVSWISPAALFFVFLLTFFPWVSPRIPGAGESASANAWSLGFGDHGNAMFVIYDLLLVFAVLTAIGSLLMHLKVIPDTPQLRPIEAWRSVIVAALSLTAFLFLFLRFFVTLIDIGWLPFSFWGLLGFWVHLVAVISVLLEVWLQRRGPAKPLPRIDIHT